MGFFGMVVVVVVVVALSTLPESCEAENALVRESLRDSTPVAWNLDLGYGSNLTWADWLAESQNIVNQQDLPLRNLQISNSYHEVGRLLQQLLSTFEFPSTSISISSLLCCVFLWRVPFLHCRSAFFVRMTVA